MPRARFLIDTSAFSRFSKPSVALAAAPLIASGEIALCAPTIFEMGFSARSSADYFELISRLSAFELVPTTNGDHQRALELQHLLSLRGQQRMPSLVDALVAAVAETRGLTVLHYDADFEVLSELTTSAHQWIVPRGTAD